MDHTLVHDWFHFLHWSPVSKSLFMLFHLLKWLSVLRTCVYRDRETDNDFWQPGEVLPVTSGHQSQSTTTVTDVLQRFQANMEKQLSSIGNKLDDIQDKIVEIDHRQGILEREMKSPKSDVVLDRPSKSRHGRRKITPTALQVNYKLKRTYLKTFIK